MSGSGEIKLFIQEPWLSEIIEGRKTVEGRAAPKGNFNSWIGKTITVLDKNKSAGVKVTEVKHYNTLDEYLDVEWEHAAPHAKSKEDAKKLYEDIYYKKDGKKVQVFSHTRISDRGGIEAIHLVV
jgi:ASC-1-like (ASCH) protein